MAIITPYRKRAAHLREFVPHMRRRFYDGPIYVIEQAGGRPFNRGKLLNVGFREYGYQFDYCAYHDIDMLPMKADYSYCETHAVHLATRVKQFCYRMPFPDYFGGVVLFTREQYELADGFSNQFWGWGGEDNEMLRRVEEVGIPVMRRDCNFNSLYHPRSHPEGYDREKDEQAKKPRMECDGMLNAEYRILREVVHPSYTILTVDI
jgi:hypothetical protein